MASSEFGVRQFVNLVLLLIEFYLRHKDAIDDNLPAAVAIGMTDMAGLVDEIRAVNAPGPL